MAVVLITGCGSGFGKAMAAELALRGDEVYAAVRALPAPQLEQVAPQLAQLTPQLAPSMRSNPRVASGVIHTIALDVTSGASIEEAVSTVLSQAARIDVLVNNAGLHRLGAFEDMPESELRLMM